MEKVLFAWLGNTDIHAAQESDGLGPIGQAAKASSYTKIVLLSDHDAKTTTQYKKWLAEIAGDTIEHYGVKLSSPTAFGEIYEAALGALKKYAPAGVQNQDIVFHLSPGTPAMAAVWIILAKTRFPATLIESSIHHGVRIASVPFDISADYIPDLLSKPDSDLARLSQGLPPAAPEFEDIVHRCASMKNLVVRARRVAPRTVPVLILGESGTGKELLARAIHRASLVKNGPFVAVNCGAIPKDLVESELFGHERGAFTGAVSARKGHIEAAAGGTLFLDEVGELPQSIQVKILRTLQERQIIPVGSTKPRNVDFRLIAATNRDLIRDVAEGRFRDDLFHRIAVAVLKVPPLRDREGDVGLLIDRMLEQINEEAASQPGFEHKKLSASAKNLLVQHNWPGNIRELMNTLQRAAVWSVGSSITVQDARDAILPMRPPDGDGVLNQPLGKGFSLPNTIEHVAQHYLSRAMESANGNKTQAAELVGLPSYQTLSNWLKRYGVDTG